MAGGRLDGLRGADPHRRTLLGTAPAVTVAKPVVKDVVGHDDYTGRLNAVEFVEVRARVTGYLAQINFKHGAFVKKGDVLFVIDRRPYQATLDSAQAALTQATLNFDFTEVRAPVTGKIGQRLVTEGNIVVADTTRLITIVSLDPICCKRRLASTFREA